MVNIFNCIFLIFCMILNVSLPFLISFLIFGKRGAWYKYFVSISILYYLTGVLSITIIDYIENAGNEFESIFFCECYDKKYDLGTSIAIYQFSLLYYFLIPLMGGIIFWFIKHLLERRKE
jgi:hypothetical protein